MTLPATWINLGEPRLRSDPVDHSAYIWPAGRVQPLARVDSIPEIDLVKVTMSRRSCREFGGAPQDEALGHLLYLTLFAHATTDGPHGYVLKRSCVPSAGAIHGVHVLVQRFSDMTIWRYDSIAHALVEIEASEEGARLARSAACAALNVNPAALLIFVAEPGKYAAKYEAPGSLIWRDAGVLVGAMSLVAEALGLGFCPLGVTGESTVRLLDQQLQLVGVGMAALGSR